MPARPIIPRTSMDSKGRIVVPKLVREAVKLKSGDIMEIEVYGDDKILLTILGKQ